MAGGIGSRFWPMSTIEKPKQFIDILNVGKTMLQQTFDRFRNICPITNVFVVTSENYRDLVKDQLPEINESQILLEPCMRNTAPAIAYAVWKIKKRNQYANIVVSPSDHFVVNLFEFERIISEGLVFTENHDALLTLGIKPHKPETGYGYIKKIKEIDCAVENIAIKKVEAFVEKPTLEVAKEYLVDGNYFWNSGIFIWSTCTIEKAFRSYIPKLATIFDSIYPSIDCDSERASIQQLFPTCPNISIDYGIMENASNIYVYPSDFGWSDMGSWGSLHELSCKTEEDNVLKGNIHSFETANSIIMVNGNKKAIVQGLLDYIVIDTEYALLICKRDQEQQIKNFHSE